MRSCKIEDHQDRKLRSHTQKGRSFALLCFHLLCLCASSDYAVNDVFLFLCACIFLLPFWTSCRHRRTCRTIYLRREVKSPKAKTTKKEENANNSKNSCLMCSVYPFVFSFLFVMTTNQKKQLPPAAQSGPKRTTTKPNKYPKSRYPYCGVISVLKNTYTYTH